MGKTVEVLVIGGGFYGCCIALYMAGSSDNVVLVERHNDLLLRASRINQARIHTGYHYPRSFLTAYRSLVNFPRFVLDFRKAIVDDFRKLYGVAIYGSKINANRFFTMFKKMGAEISDCPDDLRGLFNKDLIEDIFLVREYAFDANILRQQFHEKLHKAGLELYLNSSVVRIKPKDSILETHIQGDGGDDIIINANYVINCTYSSINTIHRKSGLELLPLKHELTEMAIVDVPEELQKIGITVMDGPFFSIMPYPAFQAHSLSHVRYTPHFSWIDRNDRIREYTITELEETQTNFIHMIKDAQRYMPILSDVKYLNSAYEIKTLLIENEIDDGRPILFKRNEKHPNFITIMGGKIDNVYDILDILGTVKMATNPNSGNIWRYLFPEKTSGG